MGVRVVQKNSYYLYRIVAGADCIVGHLLGIWASV